MTVIITFRRAALKIRYGRQHRSHCFAPLAAPNSPRRPALNGSARLPALRIVHTEYYRGIPYSTVQYSTVLQRILLRGRAPAAPVVLFLSLACLAAGHSASHGLAGRQQRDTPPAVTWRRDFCPPPLFVVPGRWGVCTYASGTTQRSRHLARSPHTTHHTNLPTRLLHWERARPGPEKDQPAASKEGLTAQPRPPPAGPRDISALFLVHCARRARACAETKASRGRHRSTSTRPPSSLSFKQSPSRATNPRCLSRPHSTRPPPLSACKSPLAARPLPLMYLAGGEA